MFFKRKHRKLIKDSSNRIRAYRKYLKHTKLEWVMYNSSCITCLECIKLFWVIGNDNSGDLPYIHWNMVLISCIILTLAQSIYKTWRNSYFLTGMWRKRIYIIKIHSFKLLCALKYNLRCMKVKCIYGKKPTFWLLSNMFLQSFKSHSNAPINSLQLCVIVHLKWCINTVIVIVMVSKKVHPALYCRCCCALASWSSFCNKECAFLCEKPFLCWMKSSITHCRRIIG